MQPPSNKPISLITLLTGLLLCTVLHAQQSFFIARGTTVAIGNGLSVSMRNVNLVNNGSLRLPADSPVVWLGVSPVYIAGDSVTQFNNTILRRNNAWLTLKQDIAVNGNLVFEKGYINLNGRRILLGNDPGGQLVNENDLSVMTGDSGYVSKTTNLVTPVAANPGNLGLVITSTQSPGITTIQRFPYSLKNESIRRVYKVVTTNNTNLNAAIRFKYLVYETIGISEPMLSLLNSLDGKKWAMSGGVVNTANHYLDYTGANNLNWFTLAPYNTSLPIMLSGFTATCQSAAVLLQWQTQQEINSDYIEVQAGTDGSTWTALGQLKARGNIFTTQQYTFTDNTGNGRKYYRLKLVDLDGSFRYSPVYKVGCDIKDFSVTTFPNPVTINADIIFNGLQKKQVRIELLNAAGQLVYSEYIGAVGNYKRHSIAMTGFATGTYYLRTRAEGDYIKTIAIQKQ